MCTGILGAVNIILKVLINSNKCPKHVNKALEQEDKHTGQGGQRGVETRPHLPKRETRAQ